MSFLYKKIAIPISTWLFSLFLLTLSAGYFYYGLLSDIPPLSEFAEYNQPRMNQFHSGNEVVKIVMMGDSRLRYATPLSEDFSVILSKQLHVPVQVLRLTHDMAILKDFRGLFPDIYDAKPDLIVIQQEMLTKKRTLESRIYYARRFIESEYFGSIKGETVFDQEKFQVSMGCGVMRKSETAEERRDFFLKWAYFSSIQERPQTVTDFLSELGHLGIPLLVVSIPVSPKGRSIFPIPQDEPVFYTARPEYNFSDSQYCDVVHLNTKGRNVYTAWLAAELEKKLKVGG
ncbi:hypothetical protein ACJJIW_00735 [Microbulbifer sp. JMSA004]|uniref:hypothetical protein n=1 Tax=Microbulbifer sp. JMSA004 TaxID=3243370 RepID=UPI00403A3A38